MYTKEHVIEAIRLARELSDGKNTFDIDDIFGCTEMCTYDMEYTHSEDEIIKLIKDEK